MQTPFSDPDPVQAIKVYIMIKIYHNPRCRKSREGLEILQKSGQPFETVKYLEDIPTKEELRQVLVCLDISPENLIRKNEAIWKTQYRGRPMSDEALLDAMIQHPNLIERPIVVKGDQAVIGRPPEKINALLR